MELLFLVSCGGFHFWFLPFRSFDRSGHFLPIPFHFLYRFGSFGPIPFCSLKGRDWNGIELFLLVKGMVQGTIFKWFEYRSFYKGTQKQFNSVQIPVLLKGTVIERVFDKGTVQYWSNTGPFSPTPFVLGPFHPFYRFVHFRPYRSVPHCTAPSYQKMKTASG